MNVSSTFKFADYLKKGKHSDDNLLIDLLSRLRRQPSSIACVLSYSNFTFYRIGSDKDKLFL